MDPQYEKMMEELENLELTETVESEVENPLFRVQKKDKWKDKSTNKIIILKLIKCEDEDNEKNKNNLEAMGKLNDHPYIIKYLKYYQFKTEGDFGEEEFWIGITTQYCEDSVGSQIKRKFKRSEQSMLMLIRQCLIGLSHIYLKKFYHLAIKPNNILITTMNGEESIKLTDFGVSGNFDLEWQGGLTRTAKNINKGTFIDYYSSPEFCKVLQNKENYKTIDPQLCDVFSLGVTMMHLYNLFSDKDILNLNMDKSKEKHNHCIQTTLKSSKFLAFIFSKMIEFDQKERCDFKELSHKLTRWHVTNPEEKIID